MAKLVYQNFLGLAPSGDTRTNLKFGRDWEIANSTSLNLITTPIGSLNIGLTAGGSLDANNEIDALIQRFVHTQSTSTTMNAYFVEAGDEIHENNSNDGITTDDLANFPVAIIGQGTHAAHTTFVGEDIAVYRVGSDTRLFISYNDNTDGDVAICDTTGATTDFDFFSTATGGVVLSINPHPLLVAPNNFLYVADGTAIHKFDSTGSGTVSSTVIDLPFGWKIFDMIDYNGYCWILGGELLSSTNISGSRPPVKMGVFVWDYVRSNAADFSGFIKGTPFIIENCFPYIANSTQFGGKLFVHKGLIHLLVLGANSRTQLRRFTGSNFDIIWEEPGNLMPNRGGVTSYFSHILWASANGAICTFGSIASGFPETFNNIGAVTSNAGAVTIGSGGNIWVSNNTTKLNLLTGTALSTSATLLIKELPKLSKIIGITIFYPPHSDSTSSTLTLDFYKNFSTTAISGTYTLTHADDRTRGWKYFPLGGENWDNINALRIVLTWSLASGATDSFEPYRIEVDYVSSEKKL